MNDGKKPWSWILHVFLVTAFGAVLIFHTAAQSDDLSLKEDLMASIGILAVLDKAVAPDFVLSDLEGRIVRLSDHLGKVVLVNFWTTW